MVGQNECDICRVEATTCGAALGRAVKYVQEVKMESGFQSALAAMAAGAPCSERIFERGIIPSVTHTPQFPDQEKDWIAPLPVCHDSALRGRNPPQIHPPKLGVGSSMKVS